MKNKSLLKLLTAAAALLIFSECARDNTEESTSFMLSSGDMIAVNSLLGADTTIKISVRSDHKWSITERPEWISVSPEEHQSAYTLISTKISRNQTIEAREGKITFLFTDGSSKQLSIVQLGTGGNIKVGQSHHDIDYKAQQIDVSLVTNLTNLQTVSIPANANWVNASIELETAPITYKCKISIPAENNTGEVRKTKFAIMGTDASGEVLSDTIYISQMYKVESLNSTLLNNESTFEYTWTKSSDPSITYYEMNIADGSNSIIATYDITNQTSVKLDTCAIIRLITKDTYTGNIALTISGKTSKTATSIIAQTTSSTTGSFFADGNGSAASPFKVTCSRHFNNIAQLRVVRSGSEVDPHDPLGIMNKHFIQTEDITFPTVNTESDKTLENNNVNIIGDILTPFMGVYDGGDFSLSNVYIISKAQYVGIFGLVGSKNSTNTNSIIKNVKAKIKYIEGRATTVNTEDEASGVGGIAGAIIKGKIEGCTVSAYDNNSALFANNRCAPNVTTPSEYKGYAGGIAGILSGYIYNCHNAGLWIVSRRVAGGITGGISNKPLSPGAWTISNCSNSANVSFGSTGQTFPMEISIDPEIGIYFHDYNAGGICGNIIGVAGTILSITSCYNTGEIVSERNAGGIVGRSHFGVVNSCYNSGNIRVVRNTENTESEKIAAGIMAWANNNKVTVQKCYNVGTISYTDALGTESLIFLSGIVGFAGGNNLTMSDVACIDQQMPALTGDKYTGKGNSTAIDKASCKLLTDAEMQVLGNYPSGFTVAEWVIKAGYAYPQLIAFPHK